jgi:predicted Zn-dependent peptidase
MFKGSKNIGPEEHSRKINAIGGRENAFTLWDVTAYHEVVPKEHLELVLYLESERLQNLNLLPETLASEREVVKEERRLRTENDPIGLAVENLFALAFIAHPYRWPIIGWMSDLDNITLDDCINFYKTYYSPNNAVIILVGDFDKKSAINLIKKYFGKIKNERVAPEVNIKEPVQKGLRRAEISFIAEAPILLAGFKTSAAASEENYALQVISSILSSGESSRIYQNLIYKKQLAAEAGGDLFSLHDHGLFYVYALANPKASIDEVENSLLQECENIKNGDISDYELQKAKNQLEADYILRLASNYGKAIQLGSYETICNGWREILQAPRKIQAVSVEDIKKVAQKYFLKNNLTIIRVIPENTSKKI